MSTTSRRADEVTTDDMIVIGGRVFHISSTGRIGETVVLNGIDADEMSLLVLPHVEFEVHRPSSRET